MRFGRCGNLRVTKSGKIVAMTNAQSKRLQTLSYRKSTINRIRAPKKCSMRQKVILRGRGAKPYKKQGVMSIQQFIEHMEDLRAEFTMCETLYHEQNAISALVCYGRLLYVNAAVVPDALKKSGPYSSFSSPPSPVYMIDDNLDILVYSYSDLLDKDVEIGKIDGPKTIAEKFSDELYRDLVPAFTKSNPMRNSL